MQTIQALQIDEAIMKQFVITGNTVKIKVDYSVEPIIVKLGDWITSYGTTISKVDMANTYQLVK